MTRLLAHIFPASADLLAERDLAIEQRDKALADYRRQLDWNVQTIGEAMRQVEALRAALIGVLSLDSTSCSCIGGIVCAACEAWHALGFPDHFDPALLPLVKP